MIPNTSCLAEAGGVEKGCGVPQAPVEMMLRSGLGGPTAPMPRTGERQRSFSAKHSLHVHGWMNLEPTGLCTLNLCGFGVWAKPGLAARQSPCLITQCMFKSRIIWTERKFRLITKKLVRNESRLFLLLTLRANKTYRRCSGSIMRFMVTRDLIFVNIS